MAAALRVTLLLCLLAVLCLVIVHQVIYPRPETLPVQACPFDGVQQLRETVLVIQPALHSSRHVFRNTAETKPLFAVCRAMHRQFRPRLHHPQLKGSSRPLIPE